MWKSLGQTIMIYMEQQDMNDTKHKKSDKMKRMKWMWAALALAAAGCTDNGALLKSQEWQLKTMVINGEVVKNPTELPVLQFSDSARIAGSAGCNRFFGKYVLDKKDGITITPGGSTMMYCPDQQFEDSYLKALPEVSHYQVSADELTLKDGEGNLSITYVPLKDSAE